MRTDAAAAAWNASPVSSARLCAELWPLIRNEDWALVGRALGGWPQRMWNFDKHYQFIGGCRGARGGDKFSSAGGGAPAPHEERPVLGNISPGDGRNGLAAAVSASSPHQNPTRIT